MFCPKCSEAQVSEDVHFCKRCGFRLEAVQDLIASDAILSESRADGLLPRQKDISIGAGLMFIGSLVAMLWYEGHLGGDRDVLPQVYLILGFTLGFILLVFHPLLGGLKKLFSETEERSDQREKRKHPSQRTKQRDGINLGALLMFLGTIKAMALATLEDNPGKRATLTLAIATAIFLMLLVIRWLVQGFYHLFFKNSVGNQEQSERVTGDLPSALKERASRIGLTPAQHHGEIPVEGLTSREVEMVQPPSITEKTTNLLGKQ